MMKTHINQLSSAGIPPCQIMSTLRQEDPEVLLIMNDIYNVRKAQKREALGGRTPVQALVYELEKSEYQHQIKVDDMG
jgi:hypothetical protein